MSATNDFPSRPATGTVVLFTLNARYSHVSLALKQLAANWNSPHDLCLLEGTLEDDPGRICERILALDPALVAFSASIWNIRVLTHVARLLRRIRPELILMAGGPEMAGDETGPELAAHVHLCVQGEADLVFGPLCDDLLAGRYLPHRVRAAEPDPARIRLPLSGFSDEDITRRSCALETSRGCPMNCAFCTASGSRVRRFPAGAVLEQVEGLWRRGLRRFKFLDRSIHLTDYAPLLDFFLAQNEACFCHFELTPHLLRPDLRSRLAAFPAGSLQLEIGIQTFHPRVLERIGRPRNDHVVETIRFCMEHTRAHVHADLIAGLPGEDLESFARGFDHLASLGVHEIQLGILKRLRGTRICILTPAEQFNPEPPYDVLFTDAIHFEDMQRVKRMARLWDRVANSGNFLSTMKLIWPGQNLFHSFLAFTDKVAREHPQTHGIELGRLAGFLFRHAVEDLHMETDDVLFALESDFVRTGRNSRPSFMQKNNPRNPRTQTGNPGTALPERQRRHIRE